MTSEQLKIFRLKAIQQGYSPQEVQDYLSSGDSFDDRKTLYQEKQQLSKPIQTPEQPNRNILQKAAGFLDIEKAGQGIASSIRQLTGDNNQSGNEEAAAAQQQSDIMKKYAPGTTQRKDALSKFNKIYEGGIATQAEIDPGSALSNKEVLGSFGSLALNVAAPSVFKGGLKAVAAKNAVVGSAFGATSAMSQKKDISGIIKSAIGGAVVGGAIPIAGKLASKVGGSIKTKITQQLPESLMNHAIKPTLNELKKNIKTGSPTLGKELLQEGVAGSPEKLLKISDARLTSYENKLQSALKNSKGTITRDSLRPYFKDTIEKLQMTPGSKDSVVKVEAILADVPNSMNLLTANKIKRNLYDRLRDVAYKLDPSLSDTAQTMKTLAKSLKIEIEKQSGNPDNIREINKRLSIYGRLEDRVVDILARDGRNKILSLTDTIGASAALGTMNPLLLGAFLGKKAIESESVLTKTAVSLNKLNNLTVGKKTKTISKGLKAVTKRALLNAQ